MRCFLLRLRHYRKNHGRSIHFMYISLHLHYIAKTYRMRIPMSLDVIQSNTNSFQSLHRPFATFNAKQRDLENWDTCFAEACAKMVQKFQNSNFHFLVQFFFKNQYRLEKWLKVCVFNLQYQIFRWRHPKLDFVTFKQKVHPLRIL